MKNLTELVADSASTHYRAQLLDLVMQSATEGMVVVRGDKKVLYANPSMERITGYSCDELVSEGEGFLRHELDAETCKAICATAHERDHFRREVTVHKKRGGEIHVLLSLDTLRNEQGEIEYFVGLLTDVTEIKQSRDELEYMASHDALTDLPNRNRFEERLEQATSRASRNNKLGALLFLDLDSFKEVNDTLGHNIGDELLTHVAERLVDTCRKQDIITRFGGDEFVIILEDIDDIQDVRTKAGNILLALNTPFKLKDHVLKISTSIGIALFPTDGITAKELLQNADVAMYEAKKAGRNCYHLFENRPQVQSTLDTVNLA